ncbi:DUF2867 domain-containing protein [Chryseobacterium carnipullorum]|uniref:DUF2867 domain-containing protein n=1 Tax=Chryseobacterium carnipullorum TaxID=1124835 RepID=UPI000E9483DA|nr:DUF2867 domain-containing protein [Chryseobacterium carnipullorum]HBV15214.1 DUF2867 domain-containing protein [Chryseobacterium carnipullorum]
MKIKKTEFPKESALSREKVIFDYTDSFMGEVLNADGNITTAEIGKAFFSSTPQWGKKMFAFRNSIVKMFGLKTGTDRSKIQDPGDLKLEVGQRVGIFKIFDKTENEIIMGENDKHLDFRVSVLYDKAKRNTGKNSLTISTTVKYHNWMGILYFLPVRPFHQLIVPVMLKKMIIKLEEK